MKKLFFATILLLLGIGQVWGTSGTITVYFRNTPGWSNVYVTFLTSSYWDGTNGSGAYGYTSKKMTLDSGLGLYKYTFTGDYSQYIAFTKDDQSGYGNFWSTEAVYRGDFATSSPVFIPKSDGSNESKNSTKYYTEGEWVSLTTRTVYLVTNWSTPYAYAYNSCGDQGIAWHGTAMTATAKKYGGKTIYSFTTKYDASKIIFNDNGSNQTSGLDLGSTNNGKIYDGVTANDWVAYAYDQAVTVSSDDNGSVNQEGTVTLSGAGTALTATPTNSATHVFSSWTISGGGITPTTSSTNPETFKATTSGGTIRANFAPRWAIEGQEKGGSWGTIGELEFDEGTTFKKAIHLEANTTYEFGVKDRNTGDFYKNNSAFVGQTGSLTMSTSENNCHIATAGEGDYIFELDASTKALTITYPTVKHPTADYVYYDNTGKSWASVRVHVYTGESAISNNDWDARPYPSTCTIDGGTYYYAAIGEETSVIFSEAKNDDADQTLGITDANENLGKYLKYANSAWSDWTSFVFDVTLTPNSGTITDGHNVTSYTFGTGATLPNSEYITRTGYTFGGWYGNVGLTGSAIEEISTTDNGDTTLYAKWTANEYTISLNDNGGSGGDASVTATYDDALPSFTAASRDGYDLAGYFTSDNKKIINANGTLVANVGGYTDASSHWKKTDGVILYAHWAKVIRPTKDMLYRTNGSNNGWQSNYPDDKTSGTKTNVEINWYANISPAQQYKIPNFAKVKSIKLVLSYTSTGGNAQRDLSVWTFPYDMPTSNSDDAASFCNHVKNVTGLYMSNNTGPFSYTPLATASCGAVEANKWVFTFNADTLRPYAYDGEDAYVNFLITNSAPANSGQRTDYKPNNESVTEADCPYIEVTYIDDIQNPVHEYNYRFSGEAWNNSTFPRSEDGYTNFEATVGATFYAVEQFSILDYDPANIYTVTLHKHADSQSNIRAWNFHTLNAGSTTATTVLSAIKSTVGNTITAPSVDPIQSVSLSDNKWTLDLPGDAIEPIYNDGYKAIVSILLTSTGSKNTYLTANPANSSSNFPTLVKNRNRAVKLIHGSTVTYYDSIQTAHTAAVAEDTIELLRDYEQKTALTISKNIVLRGKTGSEVLTRGSARSAVFMYISESCTVKDLVISGTDAFKGAGQYPIELKNTSADKTIVFNNVTFQKFGNDQNLNGVVAVLNRISATFTDVTFSDCANLKSGSGDIFVAGSSKNINVSGTFTAPEGVYLQKNHRMVNSSATFGTVTLYLEDVYVHDYAAVTKLPESDFSKFSIANSGWYTKYSTINGGELHAMHGTRVTLNLHGGTGTESIEVGYDSTATAVKTPATIPTVATRVGYALQGYYTAESAGTKIFNADGLPVSTVTDYTNSGAWKYADTDLTLHAQWTEVTLTFVGGEEGHVKEWNRTANWSPAFVPTIDHDVVLTAPVEVEIAHAKAKSVVIYNDGTSHTGKLSIQANKGLEVTGTITKTTDGSTYGATAPEDLVLESSADGNATLIFNNSNSDKATVYMYSKGYTDGTQGGGTWTWQYVGIPMTDATRINDYYGGYMYEWNTSNRTWDDVKNTDATLTAFKAYSVTYPTTSDALHTYEIDGTLAATTNQTISVAAGQTVQAAANSWTAPIRIANITGTNWSPATIFIFNTGYSATGAEKAGSRYAANTYLPIPVNSAPYLDESYIAPMQGFLFKNTKSASAGTITLNYASAVRTDGSQDIVAGQMHAPKRQMDEVGEPMVMKLFVSDSEHDDRIILLERSDFSRGFDNGWDGEKFQVNAVKTAPRLFAINESGGKEAVSAIPEIEGTVIGFRPGTESNYTISFEYSGAETFYLFDTNTGFTTLIGDETEYTFTSNGANEDARFVISRTPAIATGVDQLSGNSQTTDVRKLLIGDMLYIERAGQVYTIEGTPVK